MLDLAPYMQPKENLDLLDGIRILADAQASLDAIGQKLDAMRQLASEAADPACDPVRRIELNLLFNRIKREINAWANIDTDGIRLLNKSFGQQDNQTGSR